MTDAVVFGGYGVFGWQVARELARRGFALTVAGRDGARGREFAARLGAPHRSTVADVRDPESCRRAVAGHAVAVHCAGPFAGAPEALLTACLDAGCHYADIAEDRRHAAAVRAFGPRLAASGLTAVYGGSSLPSISGALAEIARAGAPAPPARARVTLFIGNDNPKGGAAIRSAVAVLGRPIEAPQGRLRGFRRREIVPLPPPFGPRPAYDFDGIEYDLFPSRLGVREVTVKVGFERDPANRVFAALAAIGSGYGDRTARWLGRLAGLSRGGSSGGCVMTDLAWPGGSVRRAALTAQRDGQRMAALPCALAVEALLRRPAARGAVTADELLGAEGLLAALAREGYRLDRP